MSATCRPRATPQRWREVETAVEAGLGKPWPTTSALSTADKRLQRLVDGVGLLGHQRVAAPA
jgi:hypothetical protein